jgi:hypothetical protein
MKVRQLRGHPKNTCVGGLGGREGFGQMTQNLKLGILLVYLVTNFKQTKFITKRRGLRLKH